MATYDYDVEYNDDGDTTLLIPDGEQIVNNERMQTIKAQLQALRTQDPTMEMDFPVDADEADEADEAEEAEEPDVTSIVQQVHIGEKCTIEFAKRLNVFDNNNYILGLTDEDLTRLNTYVLNENNELISSIEHKYNVCEVKDNIAYENCALATSNLYLTTAYDEISNHYVCTIPENMKLPKNAKYQFTQSTTSNIIKPVSEIYFKNMKTNFCEERWHDWFCIPNYHLNNRWYNEVPTELSTSKSIGNCFKPCQFGYLPADENKAKCILKKQYNGGQYKYDFDYNPIALVCLLGTSFDIFKSQYSKYLNNRKQIFESSTDVELLKNKDNINVIDAVKTSIENKDNVIWTSLKTDIQKYVNDMLVSIPDLSSNIINTNVVVPSITVQLALQTLPLSKENIEHAYSIAENISIIVGDTPKYKEWFLDLKSTTGVENMDQFVNIIRMLKRACNVCFDGKHTNFSKNYLLHIIKRPPITIDETYEPYVDELKVNSFHFLQKKERWYFDEYIDIFTSYRDAIYTFIFYVIIVLCILILYVIYTVFYPYINQFLNSFITLIIFMYFDVKYYLYRYLVNSYAVDDREYQKLTFIKKLYQTFRDYDIKNYL
jgi:hypothetical protein